jgi:hypothetical protein
MGVALLVEVVEKSVVVLARAVVCVVTALVVELTVAFFWRYQRHQVNNLNKAIYVYVPCEGTGGEAVGKFGIAVQI